MTDVGAECKPEAVGNGQWCARFRVMGGPAEIRLVAPDEAQAASWIGQAAGELRRIEARYSRYKNDSIVSTINARAGSNDWTHLDPEDTSLLDFAQIVHRESEGRFDITSGVLRQVWDFASGQLPSQAAVNAVLGSVGMAGLERDGARARLARAGMQIDLGGLGKEYAADRAAALLGRLGVDHGYVNLAGDIAAVGPQADGEPWRVGIQHPRRTGELLAQIPLYRGGLATSGDYERAIVDGGHRWHHILNARTGWPVLHWASVSVAAPRALAAGCLCTLAILLGDQGREYLERQAVSYLMVDVHGAVFQGRARPPEQT